MNSTHFEEAGACESNSSALQLGDEIPPPLPPAMRRFWSSAGEYLPESRDQYGHVGKIDGISPKQRLLSLPVLKNN
ncbi:hypothetical protein HPP92_000732 [Vanilla planifolia]|uniref:Uncharacterized protein n=1 Tax=Vanilla planifolia TaxID=51239 RepID=A0A835RPR2_VANPL|nr:hypothetical protein HPP92_000732 [Vanilla planifolia]